MAAEPALGPKRAGASAPVQGTPASRPAAGAAGGDIAAELA
ncbi:MAG: hypothetical protein ACYDBZ_11785 [Steroidobacteraceae bacterium]